MMHITQVCLLPPVHLTIKKNKLMETFKPLAVICQSCSMPMSKKEDFGTNKDLSQSNEYCSYCYQGGKFTDGGATMEQVIDKSVEAMRKMHMDENLIEQTRKYIPTLKRWKKN